MKYSQSKHRGITVRLFYLKNLGEYYKSPEWKERRNAYLEKVNGLSEVSGLQADEIHHITYPFKNNSEFNIREKYGSEKDFQLLALTSEEHEVTHSIFQQYAHNKKSVLLPLLINYYNN